MKKFALLTTVLGLLAATSAYAAEAKDNWTAQCAKCHGVDGKGQTPIGKKMGAKDYSTAAVQSALTDEAAFKAIKEGFTTPEGKKVMQPYAAKLADDEIKALVAHMRTLKQ